MKKSKIKTHKYHSISNKKLKTKRKLKRKTKRKTKKKTNLNRKKRMGGLEEKAMKLSNLILILLNTKNS